MANDSATTVQRLLAHRAKLLAFVRKRTSDADLAEDIFQDALLKALRSAPSLEEETKLLAWFYRVLRNAITDSYRRAAAEDRRAEAAVRAFEPEIEPEAERELCECFNDLIPALKPEYRELILAIELGGESPESAAKRLGVERNNLKVRRFRARQQLREKLEETCRACAKHGCLDCTCN